MNYNTNYNIEQSFLYCTFNYTLTLKPYNEFNKDKCNKTFFANVNHFLMIAHNQHQHKHHILFYLY